MSNTPLSVLVEDKDRPVHTVRPDVCVVDAVQEMNRYNIGALVVLDGGKPAGIFTERDVLVRVVGARLDPQITPVEQVMTRDPLCVTPDMSVEYAMRLVTEKHFRHLPVVDQGALCGLISSGDLTRWLVRDQELRIDDLNAYIMDVPAH